MRQALLHGLMALFLLAGCNRGDDDDMSESSHETAVAVDAVADLVLDALTGVEPTDSGVETEECPAPQGVREETFLSHRLLGAEAVDTSILDRVVDAVPDGRVLQDSESTPLGSDTQERSIHIATENAGVPLSVTGVVRDRSLSVTIESDCR